MALEQTWGGGEVERRRGCGQTPRLPLLPHAPPPHIWSGQQGERDVFERRVPDDQQALLGQMARQGSEQEATQGGGGGREFLVRLLDALRFFVHGLEADRL